MMRLVLLAAAAALSGLPAWAQTAATSVTDLNIRSGPGPQYTVAGVIPANESVTVQGCLAAGSWCQVDYGGTSGWAYGDYLTATIDSEPVVLTTAPARSTVTVIEDNEAERSKGAATVGGFGAIAGAILGGPPGAAAGTVIGAATGGMAAPDDEVRTYVVEHPVEPVFLDGEVVVGAGIPETVTLTPVPDTAYSYVYLNGQPVIVQNENRVIGYVVR